LRVAAAAVLATSVAGSAIAAEEKQAVPPGVAEAEVAPGITEAEVASRGLRPMREVIYSQWQKLCFKESQDVDAKMLCRTTISGRWDTGQVVLKVDLIESEGGPAGRVQIFVPNGLYLQAGIKVTIDEQTPLQVPYVVCLSNGCLAGIVAEPDLVSRLESGRSLRLELVNANMIGIYSSLPLEEFGNVHRASLHRFWSKAFMSRNRMMPAAKCAESIRWRTLNGMHVSRRNALRHGLRQRFCFSWS